MWGALILGILVALMAIQNILAYTHDKRKKILLVIGIATILVEIALFCLVLFLYHNYPELFRGQT